jgi:hypothetical protein
MSGCPSFDLLQELLADRLGGPEGEAVEAHVEACPACQQALERLTGSPVARASLPTALQAVGASGRSFLRRLEERPPAGAG